VSGENRPAIGDFPAGARIAGYQVKELIGRGGMAVVYRAADVRLDRQVALKVLAPELTRDSAFRQRFIRESRSGASVDHPNIIPVFEAGEADGVLFIAMRYVAGRDVRALIDQEGTLRPSRVVNIVTQVASALDAAHAQGLVHRDVKPANMLLGTIGTGSAPDHVYLSDFGLSKLSVAAVSLTGTGQFLGTIDYMSPEQVEGRPIDGRTDLYALACAAFEMLTGRPPFQRDQDLAVMWAQVSAPPPSACQLRPDLPPQVDEVIARALAKSPENRQASCLEFAAQLRAACSSARPVPGMPTELAGAVRPDPVATELAMGAVAAAGPITPPVAPLPPGEATITEGVRAVSGPGTGSPPPRPTAHDQYPAASGYSPPGGYNPSAGYGGEPGGYSPPGGYGPPGQTNQLWPGGSGYQTGPPQPAPRRGGWVLPVVVGLVVIAILAGAGLLVLHLRGNGSPQTGPTSPATSSGRHSSAGSSSQPPSSPAQSSPASSPVVSSPGTVVTDYYNAINAHQYHVAYRLNAQAQSTESFTTFKDGYGGTSNDVLTLTGVSGQTVNFKLTANQSDGTVKYYSGYYTVQDGKIVGSNVVQTG
jgi:tRNA A-37 threonylcarbamoyl transferase component Bud32